MLLTGVLSSQTPSPKKSSSSQPPSSSSSSSSLSSSSAFFSVTPFSPPRISRPRDRMSSMLRSSTRPSPLHFPSSPAAAMGTQKSSSSLCSMQKFMLASHTLLQEIAALRLPNSLKPILTRRATIASSATATFDLRALLPI